MNIWYTLMYLIFPLFKILKLFVTIRWIDTPTRIGWGTGSNPAPVLVRGFQQKLFDENIFHSHYEDELISYLYFHQLVIASVTLNLVWTKFSTVYINCSSCLSHSPISSNKCVKWISLSIFSNVWLETRSLSPWISANICMPVTLLVERISR